MRISLEEVPELLQRDSSLKNGCIIDTNVLFAASFPLDTFNEWAEKLFHTLHGLDIPIFTNINVRSEFLDLNRRVLIPEGLIDFYTDLSGQLDPSIEAKLKSLKTRKEKAAQENRTFKLQDNEIKDLRLLLSGYHHSSGTNGWELFCKDYFRPYIKDVWEDAVSELKVQFLGTRAIDEKTHFDDHPNWDEMVEILARSGVGSSDAMIINLFLKSKLSLIVTTDSDVSDAVLSLKPPGHNRYVLTP